MEKNQPFFDPYNFNIQNYNPMVEQNSMPNDPNMSPNSYYEGQYMYYRYLNQMMDYKIRCKEYENLTRDSKKI